jgi:hypothetical protein
VLSNVRHTGSGDRPGVTEPPELTSDSICTADRRGGILISFGLNRTTVRDLNPSSQPYRPGHGRSTTANEGRVSAPCCTTTDGCHRLKPVEGIRPRHAVTRGVRGRCLGGTAGVSGQYTPRRRTVPEAWTLLSDCGCRVSRHGSRTRLVDRQLVGEGKSVSRGRRSAGHPARRASGLAG